MIDAARDHPRIRSVTAPRPSLRSRVRQATRPGPPPAQRTYGDLTLTRRRSSPDSPPVLFISLDDCNDWPGFLGNHPGTITPNLDALAAESVSFRRAYCTSPACMPARTSVMFGTTPDENGVRDHYVESADRYAAYEPTASSLVDDYWAAGYALMGAGKIFHRGHRKRWGGYRRTRFYVDGIDRADARVPPDRYDESWVSPYDGRPIGRGEDFVAGMIDFGPSGRSSADDPDGQGAAWACEQLAEDWRRPLFLGFGVTATHTPWRVPQRFFDLHPLEGITLPDVRPEDVECLGDYARQTILGQVRSFELLQASGLWERAVQAYQAAMSYCDEQVGIVLDALAGTRDADDTIVVLWSDHGFHLGERMYLHKFTLWERATRVPLLFRAPGLPGGTAVDEPVSTLDIGPTLSELSGVVINAPHSGTSLLPIVADPARAAERPVVSTWMRGNHAVRRGPWRYIRYVTGEEELYDHRSDPDERVNLAGDPDTLAQRRELEAFIPEIDDGGPQQTQMHSRRMTEAGRVLGGGEPVSDSPLSGEPT